MARKSIGHARKSSVDLDDDELLTSPEEIADQEARNGLLQFDEVRRLIQDNAGSGRFTASTEIICRLNMFAIAGIRRSAGTLRRVPISITNTAHTPPPHAEVPGHMNVMCDYANAYWNEDIDPVEKAIHLSAYFMWRLNWIHPFRDGNGRTSRAVSYLALSVGLGRELIGSPTIADQIVDNKQPYYDALDQADDAWRFGRVDLTSMEELIEQLLVRQLGSFSKG